MFKKKDVIEIVNEWPQPNSGASLSSLHIDSNRLILQFFTDEEKYAVLVFDGVLFVKYGAPNDEALNGHPLYKRGLKHYTVQKVKNSSLIKELEKQNSVHPRHMKNIYLKGLSHFVIPFKDNLFEVVVSSTGESSILVEEFQEKKESQNKYYSLILRNEEQH